LLAALAMTHTAPAQTAPDPMLPTSDDSKAITLPLRIVTVTTSDLNRTRRFYQGAMSMDLELIESRGADAGRLAEHWGLPRRDALTVAVFRRETIEGSVAVRAIVVDADVPTLRPGYDSRIVGPLGVGFPVNGLPRRLEIAGALGFETTAGAKMMAFPRADGTTYDVGEFHLKAPDDVLVLGVDRGDKQPVGPIDPALDIGGGAYASVLVEDIERFGAFLRDVLGLELRRKMSFHSEGPAGGMQGLRDGEEVAFQQWFSPGARTGYLVVMELLDGPKSTGEPGPSHRGVAMWTFEVRSLETVLERWRAWSGDATTKPVVLEVPGLGRVRTAVIRTPDGLPVELFERV
jgi:catechol 2,3-dioxygenase-like lactoylglutathione lyase family enzyme